MLQLPCPRKDDTIALVTPAGKVTKEEIQPAVNWLEGCGYKVMQGEHIFGKWLQFGGSDEERRADLQMALDHPEISAILFTRGGYGTVRLMEMLRWEKFLKYPKWLIGYSDITILHNQCHRLGVPSIHAAMSRGAIQSSGAPSAGFSALIDLWNSQQLSYTLKSHSENRSGAAEGILVGGNLALIYSMLGTTYDIDTKGKILFIEDVGEYLYNIDRMMYSLKLAGKLSELKGLVIGQFNDLKDNTDPFGMDYTEIILNAVADYDFPVCFGFPSGHDVPNMPLVLGVSWRLEVDCLQSSLNMR